MKLHAFNKLAPQQAYTELETCCAAQNWIDSLIAARPFTSVEQLITHSRSIWCDLDQTDYLQAFAAHPRIGDMSSLAAKFKNTTTFASTEQSGVATANEETLQALLQANQVYEAKHPFIFIICATGKNADEMLAALEKRLTNDTDTEIQLAAEEQRKITEIRLHQLIEDDIHD